MSHSYGRVAAAILGATLALAGCSGGDSAPQQVSTLAPSVTPTTPTTTAPDPRKDFDAAIEFTELVYDNDYREARELMKPESPAARYLDHQAAVDKAFKISGQGARETSDITVDPDKEKREIKITYPGDGEDGGEDSVVWKDFMFDQGKITEWSNPLGPISENLWTRSSEDTALRTTARLVSAYRANDGDLYVVVEFSAKKDVDLSYTASYAADDGYRQEATDSSGDELAKGEKTLAYYMFEDAEFGGKLRLKIASASGYSTGNLELRVR